MSKMRNVIITLLLRLLEKRGYYKVSEQNVDRMFRFMAESPELKKLPDFFDQCAEAYKNQFLYTQNLEHKGTILAFVLLRERIMNIRKEKERLEELEKKRTKHGGKRSSHSIKY
jgi:hypothetical protein